MNDKFYQDYLEELKEIRPCTDKEREMLLGRLAAGDKKAGERLIEGHLIFALAIAKDFKDQGVLAGDLVQEANLALTLAVPAPGGALHQHGGELPVFQGPAGGAGAGYGDGHNCRGDQRFSLLPGPYDCPEAGLEDHRRPGGAALVVAHRELLFTGGLRRGEDEPV